MGDLDFLSLLNDFDACLRAGTDVLNLVQQVKRLAEPGPAAWQSVNQGVPVIPMQGWTPQMADPFSGGAQWIPQWSQLGAQSGNPWVPTHTAGLCGVNLTGVWAPPLNPGEQCYIRQFGPYLNFVDGILTVPIAWGEGVFSPATGAVFLHGFYATGAPFQILAQLTLDWTMQGMITGIGVWGPVQQPLYFAKVA